MATAGRNVWCALYRYYGTGRPAYWRGSCYGRCHFGQLTMSMLIDNFGWLGNASIPFSLSRIGAIVCLGIALFFIYSSSRAKAATAKIPASHRRGS